MRTVAQVGGRSHLHHPARDTLMATHGTDATSSGDGQETTEHDLPWHHIEGSHSIVGRDLSVIGQGTLRWRSSFLIRGHQLLGDRLHLLKCVQL